MSSKVLIILDQFEKKSEVFIYRELNHLIKEGVSLSVFVLNPLKDPLLHQSSKNINSCVVNLIASPVDFTLSCIQDFSKALKLLTWCFKGNSFRHRIHKFKAFYASFACGDIKNIKHIHAHFAYVCADVAYCLSERLNCKFSISAHAWDIYTQKEDLLKERVKDSDKVFCCHKHGLEVVSRFSDKSVLSYHGIPVESVALNEIREGVLIVLRAVDKKGLPLFIKIIHKLMKQGLELKLTVVGITKNSLCENGLTSHELKHVKVYNYLSDLELKEMYLSHKYYLQTSQNSVNGDREGVPNTLLEALLYGCVVFTTPVGAIHELIEHNLNGIVYKTADNFLKHYIELSQDEAKYNSLQTLGREKVASEYDQNKCTKPLVDYLKEKIEKV